ncbi:hypothetical protein AVEN_141092-1, partial [Araneus ventricosus]
TATDLSQQLTASITTTVSGYTLYRRLREPAGLSKFSTQLRLSVSGAENMLSGQQHTGIVCSFRTNPGFLCNLIYMSFYGDQQGPVRAKKISLNITVAEALVWNSIILSSLTVLRAQSGNKKGHIYGDIVLKQHVPLFRGAMGADFIFPNENVVLTVQPRWTNVL